MEKILDFFIHENQKTSSDRLFRARVLISIIQIYIAILLVGAVLFRIFTPLQVEYQTITYIILSSPALLFIGILFHYKSKGHHGFSANASVTAAYLLVFLGVFISGGPFLSPANYVLPIPPLLAFCIIGRKPGFYWAGIVLATQIFFITIAFNHYPFPFMVDEGNVEINESIDWVIAYIAILSIAVIYETMNMRLKNERDTERARYQFMATHDALTGLPNRVLFLDRLNNTMLRSQRSKQGFSLLYIDLDGFKPINDNFGHNAGDEVLVTISRHIEQSLREADVVARLGGDEFAIILEGCSDHETINAMTNKIADSISKPITIGEETLSLGASIGTSIYPQDGTEADKLIQAADNNMYHLKRSK